MEITYKLPAFEGPLDLLIHLIEINKVDIYDIPISEITDQYLDYVHHMEKEDMDLTSSFLVMAATLLRIKSKMLLPVTKKAIEEQGEDPRLELVNRILEYKMFKYIAQELADRSVAASRCLYRPAQPPEKLGIRPAPPDPDELLAKYTVEDIARLYSDVLKRKKERLDPVRSRYGQIEREPVKLTDKISYITGVMRRTGRRKPVAFRSLIKAQSTKEEVVVTFLAVLEMMKSGIVKVRQEALFDEIYVISGGTDE